MSAFAALLEVQDLDLAADAVRADFENLPERDRLAPLEGAIADLERAIDEARSARGQLQEDEARLAAEVSQLARDIEAAELERYSGRRLDRDDARAHDEAQQARRERQSSLEESELARLEEIEVAEAGIADQESQRSAHRDEIDSIRAKIERAREETEAALARLAESRLELLPGVPDEVLAAYERVRGQARSGGKGAARLVDGSCLGCGIKLPSLEKKRMTGAPDDALLQCPQCRRVLVR